MSVQSLSAYPQQQLPQMGQPAMPSAPPAMPPMGQPGLNPMMPASNNQSGIDPATLAAIMQMAASNNQMAGPPADVFNRMPNGGAPMNLMSPEANGPAGYTMPTVAPNPLTMATNLQIVGGRIVASGQQIAVGGGEEASSEGGLFSHWYGWAGLAAVAAVGYGFIANHYKIWPFSKEDKPVDLNSVDAIDAELKKVGDELDGLTKADDLKKTYDDAVKELGSKDDVELKNKVAEAEMNQSQTNFKRQALILYRQSLELAKKALEEGNKAGELEGEDKQKAAYKDNAVPEALKAFNLAVQIREAAKGKQADLTTEKEKLEKEVAALSDGNDKKVKENRVELLSKAVEEAEKMAKSADDRMQNAHTQLTSIQEKAGVDKAPEVTKTLKESFTEAEAAHKTAKEAKIDAALTPAKTAAEAEQTTAQSEFDAAEKNLAAANTKTAAASKPADEAAKTAAEAEQTTAQSEFHVAEKKLAYAKTKTAGADAAGKSAAEAEQTTAQSEFDAAEKNLAAAKTKTAAASKPADEAAKTAAEAEQTTAQSEFDAAEKKLADAKTKTADAGKAITDAETALKDALTKAAEALKAADEKVTAAKKAFNEAK